MPVKNKKCKVCKVEYTPKNALQYVCSPLCAIAYTKILKEKESALKRKETAKLKKEVKEKLKTKGDHLKELQTIFNKYIRLRDANEPCISCGKYNTGKVDAGHFYSVGAYPNLRFNENNVFSQCVTCNRHRHGNIHEYRIRIVERIGQEAFDRLEQVRNIPFKPTITEIDVLKKVYRQKINSLTNNKL